MMLYSLIKVYPRLLFCRFLLSKISILFLLFHLFV